MNEKDKTQELQAFAYLIGLTAVSAGLAKFGPLKTMGGGVLLYIVGGFFEYGRNYKIFKTLGNT